MTEQEIQMLKENRQPLLDLEDRYIQFLKGNVKHVERLTPIGEWHSMHCDRLDLGRVYRLKKDYRLLSWVWVYNTTNRVLRQTTGYASVNEVIVPEDRIQYVCKMERHKLDDFELRMPRPSDSVLNDYCEEVIAKDVMYNTPGLYFCRKTDPLYLLEKQRETLREIQNKGYNVVTCGNCGNVLLVTKEEVYACGSCGSVLNSSDCPDIV